MPGIGWLKSDEQDSDVVKPGRAAAEEMVHAQKEPFGEGPVGTCAAHVRFPLNAVVSSP
jgi:hypothetical protein